MPPRHRVEILVLALVFILAVVPIADAKARRAAAPVVAIAEETPTFYWENPRAPTAAPTPAPAPAPSSHVPEAATTPTSASALDGVESTSEVVPSWRESDMENDIRGDSTYDGTLDAPAPSSDPSPLGSTGLRFGPPTPQATALAQPLARSPTSAAPFAGLLLLVGLVGASTVMLRRPAPAPQAAPVEAAGTEGMLRAGQSALARGDTLAALAAFERAHALDPGLRVARFCEGLCLADMGRWVEAYAALRDAHERDPADGVVRYHLARACVRLGRHAEAMAVLAPLLEQHPDTADTLADDPAFAGVRDHPRILQMAGRL